MAAMKDITIDVTYTELTALIAANGLFQGVNYLITDRGDRGLLFKAASRNQLEIQGTRYMLCPATYASGADAHGNNWIGVWNNTKTAALNDLTIWNGQVWKCILAVTEPLDAPDLNAINWVLIPKSSFTNNEYVEMIFTVCYDVDHDFITKQTDNKGNEFGIDWLSESENYQLGVSVCDLCDWNSQFFYGNKCLGIFNNSTNACYENSNRGMIFNNISNNINGNRNNGDIKNNKCDNIIFNMNNGNIMGCVVNSPYSIERNMNNGTIIGTWETSVIDVIVNKGE